MCGKLCGSLFVALGSRCGPNVANEAVDAFFRQWASTEE